jgi:hypothetical protein
MTLLALAGASCLAIAIASGDLRKLDEAYDLRADSAAWLESAILSRERAASRVHDLEAVRAGQSIAPERLEDLRSIVLDVASPGTGFGVRWTHPLLEMPHPSETPAFRSAPRPRPAWHQIDPVHRGPVAAFGLTLIFASVLSGGGDRKIHASSPDLDDNLPQNRRSHGEPQMPATAVLAPDRSSPSQELEWMPTPVDALEASPVAAIDDEDEGDLFYFDDEDDDQDEDEDDGFFFDDDEEDEEDEDEDEDEDEEDDDDELESDEDVSPEDDDDEDDSGFGEDDDEEYEFED